MKLNVVLDTRKPNRYGEYPIKFSVSENSKTVFIASGYSIPERFWKGKCLTKLVSSSYNRADEINAALYDTYVKYQNILDEEYIPLSAVRDKLLRTQHNDITFTQYATDYANSFLTNTRTLYLSTLKKISQFDNRTLTFNDINFAWLTSFNKWMLANGCKINTCSIHLRNIRTIINDAIKQDLLAYDKYPFRKFKIQQSVKEKEYLPLDKLKLLIAYKPKTNAVQMAKDIWLLSFYLCGINPIDIWNLPKTNDNHISFQRTKIKFREPYQIKLLITEPAQEIIDRYDTSDTWLLDFTNYKYYRSLYDMLKKKLKVIADAIDYPNLTFYTARYTFATLTYQLGIDLSVIQHALGHTDKTIAERYYITFEWQRVWDAQQKILTLLEK